MWKFLANAKNVCVLLLIFNISNSVFVSHSSSVAHIITNDQCVSALYFDCYYYKILYIFAFFISFWLVRFECVFGFSALKFHTPFVQHSVFSDRSISCFYIMVVIHIFGRNYVVVMMFNKTYINV